MGDKREVYACVGLCVYVREGVSIGEVVCVYVRVLVRVKLCV